MGRIRRGHRTDRALAAATLCLLLTAGSAAAQTDRGATLYAEHCVFCHGERGQGRSGAGTPLGAGGTQGGGPPLKGAGEQAADFYLSTGYMPLDDPHEQPKRRPSPFSPRDRQALVRYVASLSGPGPAIPTVDLRDGDLALGQKLFTSHCAGCHQVLGKGGYTAGALAPELAHATPVQVAEAIRIGPYLMPRFDARDLDDHEVASIARYMEYAKQPRDDGGWAIGHIGPVPEGFVAWLLAAVGLVGVARIIGTRLER